MFAKYIPIYKMLSPAVTQTDAKWEGKWPLDLKCLEPGEEGQIAEERNLKRMEQGLA